MKINWWRVARNVGVGDLRKVLDYIRSNDGMSCDQILNTIKALMTSEHMFKSPKTDAHTVSEKDLAWFMSEAKKLYVERGCDEGQWDSTFPPITYTVGPEDL